LIGIGFGKVVQSPWRAACARSAGALDAITTNAIKATPARSNHLEIDRLGLICVFLGADAVHTVSH
jgi:hypothetical protein